MATAITPPVGKKPSAPHGGGEQPFWASAGATWRQLGGGFAAAGFSFEWHELTCSRPLGWERSFHPESVEICLNLTGRGWVEGGRGRAEFFPETVAFYACNGHPVSAQRVPNEQHRFLSAEFSLSFLRQRLGTDAANVHPVIRSCLKECSNPGVSEICNLTPRHREIIRDLLNPPVIASARPLWYESKALEVASEFFFEKVEAGPVRGRADRLAMERVVRAKAILAEDLCNVPSLTELGRRVGCSHFYLSRTFSMQTGLTISQWLRGARLDRAAELLRAGRCNVTEAALEVGYSSMSHFSMAFHERFGCCAGLYPLRTPAQRGRT